MEETTNEVIKLFKERLKYPIITVYFIILVIYNWDVLSIFFLSDMPIVKRVAHLNYEYAGQGFERIAIPFVKAIVVSILAPATMFGLDWLLRAVTRGRQNLKNERIKTDLENKEKNAILQWKISEANTGNKTIVEWQEKEAAKEAAMENMKSAHELLVKSLEDKIVVQERVISNLKQEGSRLETDYKSNQELLDRLQGSIIELRSYVETYIEVLNKKLKIPVYYIYVILGKMPNVINLPLPKLKEQLKDEIPLTEVQLEEALVGLAELEIIKLGRHNSYVNITPHGYGLYINLEQIHPDLKEEVIVSRFGNDTPPTVNRMGNHPNAHNRDPES